MFQAPLGQHRQAQRDERKRHGVVQSALASKVEPEAIRVLTTLRPYAGCRDGIGRIKNAAKQNCRAHWQSQSPNTDRGDQADRGRHRKYLKA
jgi:hypothetical protein